MMDSFQKMGKSLIQSGFESMLVIAVKKELDPDKTDE